MDAPARLAVTNLAGPLAQTGATGDATSIVTLVAQIGLSAIFLWQWRDERAERRATQAAMFALAERMASVLHEATETLGDVKASMSTQVDRLSAIPGDRRFDMALRRMELAADEMSSQVRRMEDTK